MAKIRIPATILKQKDKCLYMFKLNSSLLNKISYVTPRSEDNPDELQRVVNLPREMCIRDSYIIKAAAYIKWKKRKKQKK